MRILVTGGAGFIGSHLVEHHLKKGDEVFVVDDFSTGKKENLTPFMSQPNFKFEEADISKWQNLEKRVQWADRIYHMAAVVGIYRVLEEPLQLINTNIAGTHMILDSAMKSPKKPEILLASSSEVYGHSEKPTFTETDSLLMESADQPRWNYAITKLADEALAYAYTSKAGLPIINIRFFNTIGPRQRGRYGMVVPRFVQQACDNKPLTVYGDGTQTRSFCDVRDTVIALDQLCDNKKSFGQIVNVGNDQEITILELAQLIKERAGSKSEIEFVPYEKAYTEAFVDIMRRRPNLEKFTELSHFKHKWTLMKTIDDLIDRYRKTN